MTSVHLEEIPRGNTCPGVNRAIIEHLASAPDIGRVRTILDVPCGNGEFLDALTRVVPNIRTFGCDVVRPRSGFSHNFIHADLNDSSGLDPGEKLDHVTCISGVMEFDNTLAFLARVRKIMATNGELIVTNDNLLSIRDRLLYLLFGRFWQYKFTLPLEASSWKIITMPNLIRILHDAGFELDTIKYVAPKLIEWSWFPLAAVIFAFQRLGMPRIDGDGPPPAKMLPFISLLSRHYILYCRPRAVAGSLIDASVGG